MVNEVKATFYRVCHIDDMVVMNTYVCITAYECYCLLEQKINDCQRLWNVFNSSCIISLITI